MKWLSDKTVDRLRASAAAPDLSGTRYRLVEPIGRGGMGAVYLAEDTSLGRRVALKVLDLPDPSGELAARMLREARVIARLEHPGIVPVHDVGTLADGRVFYTMKYVQGQRLDRHLEQVDSLPERLRIFQRICEAAAFAHARGVLHRDLKPENIMVGPFGEVLVMDWGVAKILRDPAGSAETLASTAPPPERSRETAHGAVLGTPGYMAPEQARGEVESLDERADIYALGAILRFLVTGQEPQQTTTQAQAQNPLPGAPSRMFDGQGVPRRLAAICGKAMAREPAGRYASAGDLASDIARYLDGEAVIAYPETWLDRTARMVTRYQVWILLILTYLVVRILLFFWPWR